MTKVKALDLYFAHENSVLLSWEHTVFKAKNAKPVRITKLLLFKYRKIEF